MVSARSLNVGGRSLAGNPGPVRMSRITNKLRTSQGGSRWFSAIFPALASSFAAPPKISVSRVWNQKAMAGRLNSMTPDQPPRTAATEPTAQPAIPLWLTGARVATAPALKGLPRRRKSLSRWQRPCGRVDCAFLDHFLEDHDEDRASTDRTRMDVGGARGQRGERPREAVSLAAGRTTRCPLRARGWR
jgi:hypothetical protein